MKNAMANFPKTVGSKIQNPIKRKWPDTWSILTGWDDRIAAIILLVGLAGFRDGIIPYIPVWTDIYLGMRTEMIGIGITALIITNASEFASMRAEKKRVILQMGSPDNAFALEAVRQLRSRGWIEDGSLRSASFLAAKLNDAFLHNADLSFADLSHTELRNVNLNGANLVRAKLSYADIAGSFISEVDLTDAKLNFAILEDATLGRSNLVGANLRGAILTKANLWGSNLTAVDMREAVLRGASFDGAGLLGVDLRGAKYDSETIWPINFDPRAAGAILVDE